MNIKHKILGGAGLMVLALAVTGVAFAADSMMHSSDTMMPKPSSLMMMHPPKPMVLMISSNGKGLLRGVVKSMGVSSITVATWGGIWTVNMNDNTTIAPSDNISAIAVGDFVGVSGMVSEDSPTITAERVRDWTAKSAMMHNDKMMGVMVGGALMTPERDIVDNAVLANNVTTLVAAVKAAGLVDTLKGTGPFTVFAPTNDAFAKLPAGTVDNLLKPENKASLVNILTYHVVAGQYTMAQLTDGMVLTTVEGKTLKITRDASGKVWINGSAMIQTPDVISRNGVTHVIDMVLMPPTQ